MIWSITANFYVEPGLEEEHEFNKLFWSHDQDGCHEFNKLFWSHDQDGCPYLVKTFKHFLNPKAFAVLEIKLSNIYSNNDLYLFYDMVQIGLPTGSNVGNGCIVFKRKKAPSK